MSIPQCSGPAWIYLGYPTFPSMPTTATNLPTPTTAQLYFLGTCEKVPVMNFNPQWEPIMNDEAGSIIPIEYSWQGENGVLQMTLNKWNEYVYRMLASHNLSQGKTSRGFEAWYDVGTLYQLEGKSFQTYCHFPYATQKSSFYPNMPVVYRFAACRMGGHVVMPGTTTNRRNVVLHLDRNYVNFQTNATGTSGFGFYDHTSTNIPAVPPVGATGQVSVG